MNPLLMDGLGERSYIVMYWDRLEEASTPRWWNDRGCYLGQL